MIIQSKYSVLFRKVPSVFVYILCILHGFSGTNIVFSKLTLGTCTETAS